MSISFWPFHRKENTTSNEMSCKDIAGSNLRVGKRGQEFPASEKMAAFRELVHPPGKASVVHMFTCSLFLLSSGDLIAFLREVAAAAPALPFYYYHIPALTGVKSKCCFFPCCTLPSSHTPSYPPHVIKA